MSFLFGGGAEMPKQPQPMPVAPDASGVQSQAAMEAQRRRAAMSEGRQKMLIVPQAQTQQARPNAQKMLLGA